MQNLRDKKLLELYDWALRYAKACRFYSMDVDEVANELVMRIMRSKWVSPEYTKQIMRRHYIDIIKREKRRTAMELKYPWPSHCVDVEEPRKWDAKIMVDELLTKLSKKQVHTMKHLLEGYNINETASRTHTNRRTIHRHILKARELLTI